MAEEKKIGVLEYIVAFASFIPFLGVLFGLASLILGALKFKIGGWKLIALGVGGILLSAGLSVGLWMRLLNSDFGKGEIYLKMARRDLRTCVMALEFYKRTHGRYPATLREVAPFTPGQARPEVDIFDTSAGLGGVTKGRTYQYELATDGLTYRLYGVGPDGKSGTTDDGRRLPVTIRG